MEGHAWKDTHLRHTVSGCLPGERPGRCGGPGQGAVLPAAWNGQEPPDGSRTGQPLAARAPPHPAFPPGSVRRVGQCS